MPDLMKSLYTPKPCKVLSLLHLSAARVAAIPCLLNDSTVLGMNDFVAVQKINVKMGYEII